MIKYNFKFQKYCVMVLSVLFAMSATQNINAQSSQIDFSTAVGGGSVETVIDMKEENGFIYIIGSTLSSNLPVTNGSMSGSFFADGYVAKYDTSGNLIYLTYIDGFTAKAIDVINGEVFYSGNTSFLLYPVTDGSSPSGGNDVIVGKLNVNGDIIWASYKGGSGSDVVVDQQVSNGYLYVWGQTTSNNFPVTNGSTHGGGDDIFAMKISLSSGAISSAGYFGGAGDDYFRLKGKVDNGEIYLLDATTSNNLNVTDGSSLNGNSDAYIVKLDANMNVVYAKYIGGSSDENAVIFVSIFNGLDVHLGEVYFIHNTRSTDVPVTDGSTKPGFSLSGAHMLGKLDAAGNIVYLKYEFSMFNTRLIYVNGNVYVNGASMALSSTNGTTGSAGLIKYDASTGNRLFVTRYANGTLGAGISPRIVVQNGKNYLVSTQDNSVNLTPTGGRSNQSSGPSVFIIQLNDSDGSICHLSFFGGKNASIVSSGDFLVLNGTFYLASRALTTATGFPLTSGTINNGSSDLSFAKISLCPDKFLLNTDTLSPSRQMVCANGFIDELKGVRIYVPSDSMPTLLEDGVPVGQNEVDARYQWQESTSATGPWMDIGGAVQRNYTPQPTTFTKYYRRTARTGKCCGNTIISTSNVDTVEVNAFTAPTVDGGGIFNTCVGAPVSVTLGAMPDVATGGTAPYTYSWDNIPAPDSALEHPLVSPTTNTIYTVTVRDANGCRQLDQAIVNIYGADAGPDVSSCAGDSARLEGVPLPGVTGVAYSWSPTTGMAQPAIIQPRVLPLSTATYTLTMTFPITGTASSCNVTDDADVRVQAAPVTANFAGPDQVSCTETNSPLGTPGEAGFVYTWAPGNNLSSNSTPQTTYRPGIGIPNPDSAVYTVTARQNGCFFSDQVSVSVIQANAGPDGCGPRIIGLSSNDVFTLTDSWEWNKIDGDATIIGDSNGPTARTTEATTASRFELITSYRGVLCTDTVTVTPCGCGVDISTSSNIGCPNFNLATGDVTLTATPNMLGANPANFDWAWTPMAGLNNYNTNMVRLTDGVARTYTVTMTSKIDPTFNCSRTISVNSPGMTLPVFTANDTAACPGENVRLGETMVVGYSYRWSPGDSLTTDTSSNPLLTVRESGNYTVTVTDVGTGCKTTDVATVTSRNPVANAGPDWVICNAATVTLGTPAAPDHRYAWIPGTANWQNGTDSTFAQPQALVAINTTFIVTATDTITGCTAMDTVEITVDGSPTLPNAPDIDLCIGATDTIGSPAIGGVTYAWSPSDFLDDATKAQPIVTGTATRTYTVTGTFTGGCTATDMVTVTVHDPTFTLTDIPFCPSSGAVALGASAPAGMSNYSWTPAAMVTDANIANPSTLTPPPSASTTYTLTVTDANGCKASDGITITPSLTPPAAGGNKTLCLNETVELGSSSNTPSGGNLSYNWTPSAGLDDPTSINPTFTPTATGTFGFKISKTDAGIPCTSSDSVTVMVIDYSLPAMSPTVICQGGTASIGVANDPGSQYFWSPGSTLSDSTIAMPLASPITSTTYMLTAIGTNGCVAQGQTTVGVNADPAPVITMRDTVACLGDARTSFNPAVTPAAGVNFLWSPNDGSLSDITILDPSVTVGGLGDKTYTLSATDGIGCSSFKPVKLTVQYCPPLPVTYLSFAAVKSGNVSLLNWKTASEYNNAFFQVERLSIAGEWINMNNKVPAANNGSSVEINSYDVVDYTPVLGMNYYRIKQVDKNGTFHYSDLRSVDFTGLNGNISLFPNPAENQMTIRTTDKNIEINDIQVYSLDGKAHTLPINKISQTDQRLNTAGLSQGSYMVRVTNNNGQTQTIRFSIIR